jgi:hypothetical protein
MLQTSRNVAIIALLALAITVLPGGDAAADTALAALQIAFLAAIAWFAYRIYREQQLTLATLTDGQRGLLFGALGVIALLIAGYDEFRSWGGGGVLAWIALLAGSVAAIFLVWRQATSYS